jgi:hypothetical protein
LSHSADGNRSAAKGDRHGIGLILLIIIVLLLLGRL